MIELLFLLWIVLCFLAAAFAMGKKIGFWAVFFISLILSPVIGLIFALASGKKESKDDIYVTFYNEGERAEAREDYKEALVKYQDSKFELNKLKINSQRLLRLKKVNESIDRVKELIAN